MSKIHDWNPDEGDALQGDICLFRVPDEIHISLDEEIFPKDNRLILAEGEVTGHHHAIWLRGPVMFRDDGSGSGVSMSETRDMIKKATGKQKTGTAKLYRDRIAVNSLFKCGELTTINLAIGFLIVKDGPVVLYHDEHDAIRIPPGRYYVGRQQEWDASEARKIAD